MCQRANKNNHAPTKFLGVMWRQGRVQLSKIMRAVHKKILNFCVAVLLYLWYDQFTNMKDADLSTPDFGAVFSSQTNIYFMRFLLFVLKNSFSYYNYKIYKMIKVLDITL